MCFWAAYVPALYFICIMTNYLVVGGLFTIFPVSVTNVFGLERGPQIYVWILFGGVLSAVLNLFSSKYLLPATSFIVIYYAGALTQIVTIALVIWFKEELDVQNLA